MAKRCVKCFVGAPRFAPKLVASGHKAPKDAKCPVCGAYHDFESGRLTEEVDKEKAAKIKAIRDGYSNQYWIPDDWR